ncbi:tail fiber protein [Yersinia enterocolitica]|nr:tail fiber protein [Yersinia enterocolitica]
MPDLPPTQSNEAKWFTEGGNGVSPSWPGSTWFNIIQAEMLNVLAAASITPDKENLSQLSEAIQHLITSGVPDLKDASLTQKGIVQLSNATNSNSEILAATPKAVSDLGALLLKITNNLSEIKDAGPAAVAQTLANLGLGDAAKMDDVKALVDAVFPIGIPLPYPLADIPAPAQGIVWFKMNGGSFNTTTYPKLAAKYPTGVLPDLRGEFIRGFDDGRGVRSDQNLLGWQGHGIQSHNHGITNFEVRGVTGGPTSAWFTSGNGLATSNSGGDETRPRNIAFNYIVRAA